MGMRLKARPPHHHLITPRITSSLPPHYRVNTTSSSRREYDRLELQRMAAALKQAEDEVIRLTDQLQLKEAVPLPERRHPSGKQTAPTHTSTHSPQSATNSTAHSKQHAPHPPAKAAAAAAGSGGSNDTSLASRTTLGGGAFGRNAGRAVSPAVSRGASPPSTPGGTGRHHHSRQPFARPPKGPGGRTHAQPRMHPAPIGSVSGALGSNVSR